MGERLVWGPYRVEHINLDGHWILRVAQKHDRGLRLLGYCRTLPEALAVLERNGVPLDQLVREDDTRPDIEEEDDPECE